MKGNQLSLILIFAPFLISAISAQVLRVPLKKINLQESKIPSFITNFLSKTTSIDIRNYMNRRFQGTIQLGSNHRELEVILDTGSSVLWVGDSHSNHFFGKGFDCSQSSTCKASKNLTKNITYGSGSINGYQITEDLKIGNITLKDFKMLLAKDIDPKLKGINGILGLSLGRSSSDFPTVLELLKAKNLINVSMFSIYLGDDSKSTGSHTGEIIFGGYDPKYALSDFKFVTIKDSKESMFWQADMNGLGIGKKALINHHLSVIFDSGTSLLILPEDVIKNLIKEAKILGVSCRFNEMRKKYLCDCSARDKLPDLTFYFDNVSFNIPATSYIEFNYGSCDLLIDKFSGIDSKGILGDVFLKHYYTLYSAENNTIGFAHAAPVYHIPVGFIVLCLVAGLLIIAITVFFCTKPKIEDEKVWKSSGILIGGSGKNRLLENDGSSENAHY